MDAGNGYQRAISNPNNTSSARDTEHLQYLKKARRFFTLYEGTRCSYPFRFDECGRLHRIPMPSYFIITFICLANWMRLWVGFFLHAGDYLKEQLYFQFGFHFFWSCCWSMGAAIQGQMLYTRNTLDTTFNQILAFNQELKNEFGPKEIAKGWKMNNAVQVLNFMYCQLIPGFSALMFIPLRNNGWFIYSHFPGVWKQSYAAIAFFFLYEYCTIGVHFVQLGLEIFVIGVYIKTSSAALTGMQNSINLRVPWKMSKELAAKLRTTYCALEILNKKFNEGFGNCLLPLYQTTLSVAFVVATVLAMKLYELGDQILIALLVFLAMYTSSNLLGLGVAMSSIYNTSNDFLNASSRRFSSRQERRIMISCRRFGAKVLGMYIIKTTAPLTMMDIAIDRIVTLLLLFPHKLTISSN